MTNMLNFFNDLTSYIDEKYGADVIYIDLEKAFDKVSHPKLHLYNFKRLVWVVKLWIGFANFCMDGSNVYA